MFRLFCFALLGLVTLGLRPLTAAVEPPVFSLKSGTYYDSADVAISAPQGATVFYTVDNREPTLLSPVYSYELTFYEPVVLKAFAYLDGESSPVTTATYNIVELPAPTLSLIGKKSFKTTKSTVKIRGTSSWAYEVGYDINGGDSKTARGVAAWSLRAKLKPGKNVITVYGIGEYEDSDPLTVKVTLLPKSKK